MERPIIINNVSEYIQNISELNKKSIKLRSIPVSSMSFYRGQSNAEWPLAPRLYRENLFKFERVLITEFLRIVPHEFENMSAFDILVKMQHFGLPTRLLDTTLNPLVALFFSCYGEKQKSKDGVVYAFSNYPAHYQQNYNVAVVMKFIFQYSPYPLDILDFLDDLNKSREIQESMKASLSFANSDPLKIPLLAVIPKLSNPRIINQDAAFLLLGMKLEKEENVNDSIRGGRLIHHYSPIDLDKNFNKIWPNPHGKIFHIPFGYKKNILDELEFLGISKNKMFPELEYQAEFITNLINKSTTQ